MKKEDLEKLEKIQEELNILKQKIEKQDEFVYPIYCKSKYTFLVVKFTSLKTGEVVVNNENHKVGKVLDDWVEHTQSDNWQQLEVCPETGFFDGQAVWCWDEQSTHAKSFKFYDVENKSSFHYEGCRNGSDYEKYEPYEGNYTPWMLEAFKTLKR